MKKKQKISLCVKKKKKAKNLKITIVALVAMSQGFQGLSRVIKGYRGLLRVIEGY